MVVMITNRSTGDFHLLGGCTGSTERRTVGGRSMLTLKWEEGNVDGEIDLHLNKVEFLPEPDPVG